MINSSPFDVSGQSNLNLSPWLSKGEELLQHVKRGEITQCSFCFGLDYSDKDAEKWTHNADGT